MISWDHQSYCGVAHRCNLTCWQRERKQHLLPYWHALSINIIAYHHHHHHYRRHHHHHHHDPVRTHLLEFLFLMVNLLELLLPLC